MQEASQSEARKFEGLPVLMTTAEVAKALKVDPSTLCRWRAAGSGPRVTWLSRGTPRYQSHHVQSWIERAAS
jgi:predicted site-specific integrase-resolvase